MEILHDNRIGEIKLLKEEESVGYIWIDGEYNDCIMFAAQELSQYLKAIYSYTFKIKKGLYPPGTTGIIILRLINDRKSDRFYDEFSIAIEDGNIMISGINDRSVLFGVYKFLEEYIGIKWPQPELEIIPEVKNSNVYVYSKTYVPDIQKRGFSFNLSGWEPVNTSIELYLGEMIAWMVRNYCNTIYVQFDIWIKHKDALVEIIKKRNLILVLNGHNFMDLFLPSEKYFKEHNEWYAINDGERVTSQQCFCNEEGVKKTIYNIIEYLKEQTIIPIDTISLWPNENFPCQCSECSKKGFVETYSIFTEKMRTAINENKLPIHNVEIIAYNALLRWDMLEEIPDTNKNDVLIACWGRDYEFSIANPLNSNDLRFKRAIGNWSEACKYKFHSKLTILEYYGTYWMMSPIFPPLNRVVCEDLDYFSKLKALGVIFLILPYELHTKCVWEDVFKKYPRENYYNMEVNSESTILSANMYMFARKSFDITSNYCTLMDEYCKLVYEKYFEHAKKLYEDLESNIALLTEYNCKLFSLRFYDTWYLDLPLKTKMESDSRLIPLNVRKWNMNDDINIPLERAKISARIIKNMDEVYTVTKDKKYEGNDLYSRNINTLTTYYIYIYSKIKSIYYQALSQINIIQQDFTNALNNLEAAREFEKKINGIHLEDIEYWISYIHQLKGEEHEKN